MKLNPSDLSGSLLIAACLNWALFGVLVTQTYNYYLAFPKDKRIVKIMVYGVLVLELAQTVVSSCDIYLSVTSSPGSPAALDSMQQHWLSVPVFGALTGVIGQLFFAYRIWNMTESDEKGTPILIAILSFASFSSAIVAGVTFFKARTFSHLMEDGNNLAAIGVWNGFGSVCDLIIAVSMPYYLMRHGTGLQATHIKIVNLIRLIIETGMVTAAVAITHFCLYFIKTTAFLIPGLTISKFYGNTMLVVLNNRIKILNGRFSNESPEDFDTPQSTARGSGGRAIVNRSVFTLPSAKKPTTGKSILVTRDRLVFRLDSHTPRTGLQSMSERDTHSAEDSVPSGPIFGHAYGSDVDIALASSEGHDHKG